MSLVGNFAHAHGGGTYTVQPVNYGHANHTYSYGHTVYRHYVTKVSVYPKKHYHRATAYVGAEYHAHAGNYPFHKHYYWKQPHYTYATHHH